MKVLLKKYSLFFSILLVGVLLFLFFKKSHVKPRYYSLDVQGLSCDVHRIVFETPLKVDRIYKVDTGNAELNRELPQWLRYINATRWLSKSGENSLDVDFFDSRSTHSLKDLNEMWEQMQQSKAERAKINIEADVSTVTWLHEITLFKYNGLNVALLKYRTSDSDFSGEVAVIDGDSLVFYDISTHHELSVSEMSL